MSETPEIARKPPHALTASSALGQQAHQADVDYLTVLAHDLRNYLTPAYIHLTMLHRRAQREQRESDMRTAARGRQALDYALLLITNLVEAMRAERGLFELTLQSLDLGHLVRQAAEVFDTGDTQIILQVAEPVMVLVDLERLRQAIHNLLANAVAHSPTHAPVTVTLQVEQYSNEKWAVLRVCNRGQVIPPHLLPQLFQPYVAGTRSRGLGLGLYLAREIVEAHCGTLAVHSSNEIGTCVVLTIPTAHTPEGGSP